MEICCLDQLDIIREIKFNPLKKNIFAVGYSTGVVELFDSRRLDSPQSFHINNMHACDVLSVD